MLAYQHGVTHWPSQRNEVGGTGGPSRYFDLGFSIIESQRRQMIHADAYAESRPHVGEPTWGHPTRLSTNTGGWPTSVFRLGLLDY